MILVGTEVIGVALRIVHIYVVNGLVAFVLVSTVMLLVLLLVMVSLLLLLLLFLALLLLLLC